MRVDISTTTIGKVTRERSQWQELGMPQTSARSRLLQSIAQNRLPGLSAFPDLIPRLCRCRLHIVDLHARDAVTLHFCYSEALAAVMARVANGRDLLQF